jgi:hypothetical protein
VVDTVTTIQFAGAFCFGTLIGWYVYLINRYRKADVGLNDLGSLISVIGGTAVLALFPGSTDLFGAYGIGLAVGFFSYFIILVYMVHKSQNFDVDWFLDGRRKKPKEDQVVPPGTAETIMPMLSNSGD